MMNIPIFLIKLPDRSKICIRDRSLPRSQTINLPDWRKMATYNGTLLTSVHSFVKFKCTSIFLILQ